MTTQQSSDLVKGKPMGPAALSGFSISPRRVFCQISYPKHITKKAISYLNNIRSLVATHLPWMSHLHLCMYHVWALIWALSRPWTSPIWHALLWYRPVLYPLIVQRCFRVFWLRACLRSHNWRGPALCGSSSLTFYLPTSI